MNLIKFSLIALLAVAVVALVACNKKNANQTTEAEESIDAPVTAGEVHTDPPPPQKAVQLIGFQKTPCFGKCPVYEVKFFSDGKATWNGRMHTDRMGLYEAKVEKKLIKEIQVKADAMGYWDFYEKYPTENQVVDLPTTITMVRVGDMTKTVKNTHEAPEKLEEFENYLSEVIEGLDWRGAAKD